MALTLTLTRRCDRCKRVFEETNESPTVQAFTPARRELFSLQFSCSGMVRKMQFDDLCHSCCTQVASLLTRAEGRNGLVVDPLRDLKWKIDQDAHKHIGIEKTEESESKGNSNKN